MVRIRLNLFLLPLVPLRLYASAPFPNYSLSTLNPITLSSGRPGRKILYAADHTLEMYRSCSCLTRIISSSIAGKADVASGLEQAERGVRQRMARRAEAAAAAYVKVAVLKDVAGEVDGPRIGHTHSPLRKEPGRAIQGDARVGHGEPAQAQAPAAGQPVGGGRHRPGHRVVAADE